MTSLAAPLARLRGAVGSPAEWSPARLPSRVLRLRLAGAFIALALLAAGLAAWLALTSIEHRYERQIDDRLRVSLREARAEFRVRVAEGEALLEAFARQPAVQSAFADRDRAGLRRMLRGAGGLDAVVGGRPLLGLGAGGGAVLREVDFVGRGGTLGTLVVRIPLDGALLARLRDAASPEAGHGLLLVRDGHVVQAPTRLGRASVPEGASEVTLAGERYRVARGVLVTGAPATELVALAPNGPVERAMAAARRWVALCLLTTLLTLGLLARVLAGPIFRPISELARRANDSLTDALTGLPNRRAFEDAARSELARADRLGHHVALVLLDVDDFKRVNDTFGHAVGDDVLRETAGILRDVTREIDVPARHGGEEFAILLPGGDVRHGRRVAERLRAALEEREVPAERGERVRVTASFGVAAASGRVELERLLRAADRALYRAKGDGKNCVRSSTPLS